MVNGIVLAMMAAATPAAPMTATSKWNVDYGDTACMLGRKFGAARGETILAFRQMPLSEQLEIMIGTNSFRGDFRLGTANLSIDGAAAMEGGFESYPTRDRGTRMARLTVESTIREKLPNNTVMGVTLGKTAPTMAFMLANTKAAFTALDTCNKDILKLWGVDPTERERIATPATADGVEKWITANDYPMSIVRQGAQGTTILLWTVGVDGRVGDCRTVVASGVPELDKAGCAAITKHGRYTSAIGIDGKPMVMHVSRKIVWRLPGWKK